MISTDFDWEAYEDLQETLGKGRRIDDDHYDDGENYANPECPHCQGAGFLTDYNVVPYGSTTATETLWGEMCPCFDVELAEKDGWVI